MKSNSEICDTIQFSVSDKFDSGSTLSQTEHAHLEGCSDCKQFYDFVNAESVQVLSSHSADDTFDIEQVSQTAAIMEQLQLSSDKQKKSKIISITSISIATAAAAAVAAMTISSQLQPSVPSSPSVDDTVATSTSDKVGKKVNLAKMALPKVKFEEKYIAFNHAVEAKIGTVSHSIMKLKACFMEGNAFLEEHTQDESKPAPESRFEFSFTSSPLV